MPKNSLFKFLSRKFAKTAKVDDAPTYRKYFVPDFSFLEGFDNMSVILDAGPTELLSAETVEVGESPQLEPEAPQFESVAPQLEPEAPQVEPEAPQLEPEAAEPMQIQLDTAETETREEDTAELAIVEPEPTEKAALDFVSTGMNSKH